MYCTTEWEVEYLGFEGGGPGGGGGGGPSYAFKSDCILWIFHMVAVQESHILLKILFEVNILIHK